MSKPVSNSPDSFLPLTPATFQIMLALAKQDLHGYGIMQVVDEQSNGLIKLGPGTLYSIIKRLLKSGLIIETESRIDPSLDDERRRYYTLTDIGQRTVRAEAQRLSHDVAIAKAYGLLSSTS